MAPKKEADLKGQQTLFSFFKKPTQSQQPSATPAAASASSSSASSLATPPRTLDKKKQQASTSASSLSKESSSENMNATIATKATPLTARNVTSIPNALTSPPVTSDGLDPMEIDQAGTATGSSSAVKNVPTKRNAPDVNSDEDEDEEEESVVPPKKRATTSKKPIVRDDSSEEDTDDEEAIIKRQQKKRQAVKSKSSKAKMEDDDAFSASATPSIASDSEGYFDDDLDAFLDEDFEQSTKSKTSYKPAPAKKPTPSSSTSTSTAKKAAPVFSNRPAIRPNGSGSGSGNGIKTQAELAKEKAKEQKSANEKVFDFLVDPKDADGIRPGEDGYDPRTLYIPKKAWASFTPFEQQFWEIKQFHYDTVLFFQKGKFFELYEEDASIGHREFDLKLTDRVKMKMVGVPEASFDFWASKFLAQGYKVGRVDQCETALGAEMRQKDDKDKGKSSKGKGPEKQKNGKAIVRRELKSVLTTGTIVDASMLTDDLASHCVAIKEYTPNSNTNPSFGVCVLDAATAEFSLSYFSDDTCRTQIETLIRQLKPKELIHEKSNLSVTTLRVLRNSLSIDCQWTALKPETEFLEAEGTRRELRKLFGKKKTDVDDDEEDMEVEETEEEVEERIPKNIQAMYDKPVAMSALGGMIWYLHQLNLSAELVTNKNFNIYDPLSQGKALVLDGQTLAHIEVLQNSQGGTEGTLLSLLSHCVTPFGKRLFKIWLCAPLREAAGINDRLDAVEDILARPAFKEKFDKMARKLPDLERLLSRIHAKTCKKQEFLKVVAAFDSVCHGLKGLIDIAEDFNSTGVTSLLRGMPDIETLLDSIKEIFEGEDLLPVEGKDEKYEKVRQKVEDIEEALQEHLSECKTSLKCKTIDFKDIGTKDIYQIQVPVKIKVPGNWTKMSNTKDYTRYYSPEVVKLVQKLKEARERKTAVVNDFQFKVYGEFDKNYAVWLQVVKHVAELDCLVSLATSSSAVDGVRPEIIESNTAVIEFEELRYPSVMRATATFIPNDVQLGGEAEQMILLTGPNMAGKSTMLRMTCAAIIMAQIGCFVPAARARISPIDAIYSRMGANDAIFANASTFKVEMDDCNKILSKATPRSLVILDELGRGTSTYDGMAIAFAVLHRLATHVGCIGFFATHFTSLTEDFNYHPQIRLCNMQTQVDDATRAVVFLYKLVAGASAKSYGANVASMAGLPQAVVHRAIDISKQFEQTSRAHERAMRASESLSLALQADAAFLLRLSQVDLDSIKDRGQLLRSLKIIRAAAKAQSVSA